MINHGVDHGVSRRDGIHTETFQPLLGVGGTMSFLLLLLLSVRWTYLCE